MIPPLSIGSGSFTTWRRRSLAGSKRSECEKRPMNVIPNPNPDDRSCEERHRRAGVVRAWSRIQQAHGAGSSTATVAECNTATVGAHGGTVHGPGGGRLADG